MTAQIENLDQFCVDRDALHYFGIIAFTDIPGLLVSPSGQRYDQGNLATVSETAQDGKGSE